MGGANFFPCFFHEFAISNSYIASSQRLGEGAPTSSQSAHRELGPTYPHQVYRLVCSHLRNLASAVDQYSSSQPASLIFAPTSGCNLNKCFFKLRERQSHFLARKNTPVDIGKRDVEACVLAPSILAGRCVGALWVACWACPTYHNFVFTAAATRYVGFLELKKSFFKQGCFGCGEIFWCSDWHEIVILFSLHLMPV